MECWFVRQRTRDIEFCGKTQCSSTKPRVYSVFFAFMGLDFDPCPSPCPWPRRVQKGKTVTIREKLIGTNTGHFGTTDGTVFRVFLGEAPGSEIAVV